MYAVLPGVLWYALDSAASSWSVRWLLASAYAAYTVFLIADAYTADTYGAWIRRQCRRLLGVETVEPPEPHDIEAEAEVTEQ